jgi:hypothetical protein
MESFIWQIHDLFHTQEVVVLLIGPLSQCFEVVCRVLITQDTRATSVEPVAGLLFRMSAC